MTTLFWVLSTSLSVSFLCSILEAVLLSITRGHVAVMKENGEPAGDLLEAMQAKIDEPIAAILTLNTIAHTMGAAMGGSLAYTVFGEAWVAAFSAVLTFVILVATEIIPKTVGATFWKQLAAPTAYVLRSLVWIMKPILVPLSLFSRAIASGNEQPTVSRVELEVLAGIGRREGTLDEDEWQVVTNVIRLDEVTVGEVMTPRIDMTAVPITATLEEARTVMLGQGHLRLPVYDETVDNVVGILLARDLWQTLTDGGGQLADILRPAQFAPASKLVEDLIPEMRAKRTKMTIVLDEFGGTAGLVTLEDLIEEIVGEIQDEHEEDEPENWQRIEGKRAWRIWGGVPLRDVVERFELSDVDADSADTLGGWLFAEIGRVARVDDVIETDDGRFRVTQMRGRRIEFAVYQPGEEEPDEE